MTVASDFAASTTAFCAPTTTASATEPDSAYHVADIASENAETAHSWDTIIAEVSLESNSLIGLVNHDHIFSDYPQKGKLPVRRYQTGEVIPFQNSVTFATMDD